MSRPVAVVTDSTAYLPRVEAVRLGITVIPLQVIIGGRVFDDRVKVFDDRVKIDPATLKAALDGRGRTAEGTAGRAGTGADATFPGPRRPGPDARSATSDAGALSTSRPAPERFAAAYEAAAAGGAAAVVSVHLSGGLSGTVDAARLAARDAPIPVEVIDSRSIAMGLGFAVLAAAETARAGGTAEEVAAAARRRLAATHSVLYVDTLEYLRRGGRIGAAASLLGSALMIKPLLRIEDGTIVPLEKVRTASRALARLEDLTVRAAGEGQVDIAVHHLAAREKAESLAGNLTRRVPGLQRLEIVEVGAAIAVHVGPGMLGVVVSGR